MAKKTRKGKVVHVTFSNGLELDSTEGFSMLELALSGLTSRQETTLEHINVEYKDHEEKKITKPKGTYMGNGCYMVSGGPIASGVTKNTQRAAKLLRK